MGWLSRAFRHRMDGARFRSSARNDFRLEDKPPFTAANAVARTLGIDRVIAEVA